MTDKQIVIDLSPAGSPSSSILPIDTELKHTRVETSPNVIPTNSYFDVQQQIDQTAELELHARDTLYHHLFACCCNSRHKGEEYERKLFTKIDHFTDKYIYSWANVLLTILSVLVMFTWILSGLYNLDHGLTSFVYFWFSTHQILLFFTANYRMFKLFLFSFAFWYKLTNILVAVVARQLCINGTERFTHSLLHGLSSVLVIIVFLTSNAVVAMIKAYHWPTLEINCKLKCCTCNMNQKGREMNCKFNLNVYLKCLFVISLFVLSGVQIFVLFFSEYDYIVSMFGYTLSLRTVSISAFNSAVLWYLQQAYYDFFYPSMVMTTVGYHWSNNENSHQIHKRFRDVNAMYKTQRGRSGRAGTAGISDIKSNSNSINEFSD